MKNNIRIRTIISFVLAISLLSLPITANGKKGDKHFKRGMDYEQAQQWNKAAQEFTLAVAADPSNMEYQLHFRRASFNASQTYMQQGRSLSERGDFVGAYNAFRRAYAYDPANELARSMMERAFKLQTGQDERKEAQRPGPAARPQPTARLRPTAYESGRPDRHVERRAGSSRVRHRRAEADPLDQLLGLDRRLDARLGLAPPHAVAEQLGLFWKRLQHFQKLRESP